MQVEEVDTLDAQTLQARVTGCFNCVRPVIGHESPIRRTRDAVLAGEKHPIASPADAGADEALVLAILVAGRGVEMVYAAINRLQERDAGFGVIACAVPAHQAHAAEAECREPLAGLS